MNTSNSDISPELFHESLHKDINKPILDYRKKWVQAKKRHVKIHSGAHRADWSEVNINLKNKTIDISVYLNFKKNSLTETDYRKLKILASEGIAQYQSRNIKLSNSTYIVKVQAHHRSTNAIPVDLYIETDEGEYGRSMNPAMLGIDASFIYNKGAFGDYRTDLDFRLVSAHEFGHSVLMYAGGLPLSWGHKGSTNPLTQSVKGTTPGYPKSGNIDLMKYYDWDKGRIDFLRRVTDTVAMEMDVKRLIWGAEIKWKKQ